MSEIETVKELVGFLMDPKAEVRKIAVENVAPLTTRADCRAVMCSETALRGLLRCLTDPATARHSLEALVNISHEDDAQKAMVSLRAVPTVATQIIDGEEDLDSSSLDLTCKLLSNLTRWPDAAEQLVRTSAKDRTLDGVRLLQLAQKYAMDPKRECLDHLASVFCNVSATAAGREALVGITAPGTAKSTMGTKVLGILLPTVRAGSVVRRRGVVGCVRNCAFEENAHEWALCDDPDLPAGEVDESKAPVPVLPYILPMLVGPEPFRESEAGGIPAYVMEANRPGSTREPDYETRVAAVDVIVLLCRRRRGRDVLREKFVYPVMRELHVWETTLVADKVDDEDFEPPEIMESIQRVVDSVAADEAEVCPIEDGPAGELMAPEDLVD